MAKDKEEKKVAKPTFRKNLFIAGFPFLAIAIITAWAFTGSKSAPNQIGGSQSIQPAPIPGPITIAVDSKSWTAPIETNGRPTVFAYTTGADVIVRVIGPSGVTEFPIGSVAGALGNSLQFKLRRGNAAEVDIIQFQDEEAKAAYLNAL